MTAPRVDHPPWCGLAATGCTVDERGHGTHKSRSVVIKRNGGITGRTDVFVEQSVDGPGHMLVIFERYEEDAEEPEIVLAFRLAEARKAAEALDELLALATPH